MLDLQQHDASPTGKKEVGITGLASLIGLAIGGVGVVDSPEQHL